MLKMKLTEELLRVIKPKAKSKAITSKNNRWGGVTVTTDQLVDDDIQLILGTIENDKGGKTKFSDDREPLKNDIKNRRVVRNLKAYLRMKEEGAANAKIKKLDLIPAAIRDVLSQKAPNKWLYKPDDSYGWMMPWFVKNVEFYPPDRSHGDTIPAHVDMTLMCFRRGKRESTNHTWYARDLYGGKTVEELLSVDDFMIETEDVNKEYRADMQDFEKWAPQLGEQFIGEGDAETDDGRYWSSSIQLEVDGVKAKLVMDTTDGEDDEVNLATTHYWAGTDDEDLEDEIESEDVDDDPNTFEVPTHPICRLFHLEKHKFITCYVGCLTPYVYNKELINKLVLPKGNKELIDALTMSVVDKMDDIIAGKASGVMILCSGLPGTGKTLTAEVYAEAAKRPLYAVQCSQLGTDEHELEKELLKVLKRAVRWNAILLIDEADVYIHERGSDIHQNAIVGVLLRSLEYFAGIMFLTTNRATVVDDAIMSRMTAHVKYTIPEGKDRDSLWEILSENFGVKMTKAMVSKAIEKWPKISGRSIRQMIRLAKFMADHRGDKMNIEHLEMASQYHDFKEVEEVE